jgi:hypothetical protein
LRFFVCLEDDDDDDVVCAGGGAPRFSDPRYSRACWGRLGHDVIIRRRRRQGGGITADWLKACTVAVKGRMTKRTIIVLPFLLPCGDVMSNVAVVG